MWRPGGDALNSTRGAPAKDLADLPGWNHDPNLEIQFAWIDFAYFTALILKWEIHL